MASRTEILAAEGEELDRLASLAVGWKGIKAGDYLDDGSKILRDAWPPVSTDPTANHGLCFAALEKGLRWPAVLRFKNHFVASCSVLVDPSVPPIEAHTRLLLPDDAPTAEGPFVAIARAVALAGLEADADED